MTRKQPPAVCYPLVHLNGTSKADLIEQLEKAYTALGDAYEAMKQAAPNQRDYYPLPQQWWEEARAQHQRRLQTIDDLRESLVAEVQAIESDKPRDWDAYLAQREAGDSLAALKQTNDALHNETAGKVDSPWIAKTKQRAAAVIAAAENK